MGANIIQFLEIIYLNSLACTVKCQTLNGVYPLS